MMAVDAIDDAIVAILANDPALVALAPDGVWMTQAPIHAQRFVLVDCLEDVSVAVFQGTAFEDCVYRITATMQASSSDAADQAAARIDALLTDVPFEAIGYSWMTSYHQNRLPPTLETDVDTSVRWIRRGGDYRVQFAKVTS